jgi:hypothetical protein
MKQKVIIGVVAAIVVLAGLYLYMQNKNDAANSNNTNQNANTPQEGDVVGDVPGDPEEDPQTPTTDTIAVSTQIAGSSVTIDNVYLSKPGFIDIHEATSNGQPGKSVGVSGYLGVGAKQDLEISAPIVAGMKYFAVVHVDDGDKKYDYPSDAAAMKDGLPVQAMFSVSQ